MSSSVVSQSEFERVFVVFDTEAEGAIAKSDVGAVLRSLRLVPSDSEIAALVGELCKGPKASRAEVWAVIERFQQTTAHSISGDEIKKALYIFDTRGNRRIPSKDFWALMTTDAYGGDVFTDAEVRTFLRQLNIDDDDDVPIEALIDVFDKRAATAAANPSS
eukprot:a512788_23.p1 GENE.a512788_23~~a512788_23.p1  ORF type:complete len:170 (-),score=52.02 a512788_23:144-629(-)